MRTDAHKNAHRKGKFFRIEIVLAISAMLNFRYYLNISERNNKCSKKASGFTITMLHGAAL